jgi:uncharacterized Zn-finger protein
VQVHQRVHTKEKPFVCNYLDCGSAFTTLYRLTAHTRLHTGIQCTLHCYSVPELWVSFYNTIQTYTVLLTRGYIQVFGVPELCFSFYYNQQTYSIHSATYLQVNSALYSVPELWVSLYNTLQTCCSHSATAYTPDLQHTRLYTGLQCT